MRHLPPRRTPPWGYERPPWWPQQETWPPRRRWNPGRFFLRAILFFVLFLIVLQVLAAIAVWLVARAFGIVGVTADAVLVVAVASIVLALVFGSMGGAFRRSAMPLADLMTGVERVADGDYSVRVRVRGMRPVRRLVAAFNTMVERLERGESQRRRLLADVTHELRTPLSVIQGRLEGAIDGVYPRDEETLSAILDETRHMSRIIEDLRLLSLAESGALRLARAPLDLAEVVDDAVAAYGGSAESGGVTLENAVPADLRPVDADVTRVREVLENLLSNAIRYTPSGGRVTVSAAPEGAEQVAVTVADTGRGVPASELPLLFERFHRSPDSHGTGLGLAIARDLVRAHGGEMTATSDGEGRGTSIRFTLPAAD